MAHFAEINGSNIVVRVLVIADSDSPDEATGIAFCQSLYGGSTWVQTSDSIRKNKAGEGDTWDSARDAFIAPKPFSSWTLNETTCRWVPPVAYPDSEERHYWDEDNTRWVEV